MFLLFAAILAASVLVIELSVTRSVHENAIHSLRDSLEVQAGLIAREVKFTASSPLDDLAAELKSVAHARVTVIAADGRVLGDSDHASSTMDNHRGRLEVEQADLTGSGMAIRTSDTLKTDLLYVAKKIVRDDRPQGFIRLSVSLSDVNASIRRMRMGIIVVVVAVLAVRLTLQVRDFATSIAQGGLGRRLFLPEAGEYEEIAGSLNNMSLSLQSEVKSLHDEKARFETALLGISDGVLLLNQAGKVDLANRAFHEMFDTGGDISGKPFLEVVRNHQLADIVREAHEQHRPASAEIDIALPRQLHVYATALPILQESMREDRYRGVVIALHDITQLKKLEQMRKDFVANVSHELKTPITAIQGFAETLLEGALEDREHGREFVATIKANSERINSLVDDLMTISKIELGAIAAEKTDVAFGDVAEAVTALLRNKAEKKGLALNVSVPPDAGMLQADRDRLIQIMTNLVDNAIKFTEKGSVTFGIEEMGGRTSLFVQDTGIGVPEKHLARLGERFYRVDPARSRTMGGTGLGLAIVKHLVKAHGWDMRIESTYGKGMKVRIFVS
ncbi:MAG: phosphate regulon sensor protein [Nitrospirae bacterium]|nr:phosphate regulon sensor protein [Nitrospirota bacterium]